METKKASKTNWKHITVCVIILVLFVVTIGVNIKAENSNDEVIADSSNEVIPLKANERITKLETKEKGVDESTEVVTVEFNEFESFISKYETEIKFYSKCFGVKYNNVIKDMKNIYDENGELIETNVGHLLDSKGNVKIFSTTDRGLVEYFYDYVERNPKKVNNKRVAYTGDAEYVENLIIYFTTKVYDNVDTNVALSIGAAESGYYKSKYMLRCNNVFGGMSSRGLTKYKNIEYGVLSYVKMLSTKYYDEGLTSLKSIGRKYCPTRDNNGNKVASQHWIKLVTIAKKKYSKYTKDISVSDFYNVNAII